MNYSWNETKMDREIIDKAEAIIQTEIIKRTFDVFDTYKILKQKCIPTISNNLSEINIMIEKKEIMTEYQSPIISEWENVSTVNVDYIPKMKPQLSINTFNNEKIFAKRKCSLKFATNEVLNIFCEIEDTKSVVSEESFKYDDSGDSKKDTFDVATDPLKSFFILVCILL